MTPDEHKNAARELLEAEHTGIQIGLLTQRYPQMDMNDAYAIQKSIFKAKIAQGRQLVGWKIGLTSKYGRWDGKESIRFSMTSNCEYSVPGFPASAANASSNEDA